jgi:hypothetical protein
MWLSLEWRFPQSAEHETMIDDGTVLQFFAGFEFFDESRVVRVGGTASQQK